MERASIPGYTFGSAAVARSPVTASELELLEATLLWSPDDDRALRLAGEVLADQVEDVLDVWYGFVAAHEHLVRYFADADGEPIAAYLERVRARFGQWVRDVCERPRDQAWLDYQEEIALRHTAAKKNATDGVDSVEEIPLRYLIAFVYPITATLRPFLERRGHPAAEVDAMHAAWFKAVVLHVCLWARPYADGSW